jgi:hypothetical protein
VPLLVLVVLVVEVLELLVCAPLAEVMPSTPVID